MRIRAFLTTLVGVAIAGGSVLIAKEQLKDPQGAAIASPESAFVNVVVASRDIEFGQAIEPHLVSVQRWPREALPPGSFIDLGNVLPTLEQEPRRARTRVYQGEVLLASKVSTFGEKVTIVQKLGENTRAMAIKVDAVTAVGGFVTPGDYVDLVLTSGRSEDLRAVTVLQNIRVLGVDQKSEDVAENPSIARTITVEVTPEQGQRLALAQKAGTLSLTLRTVNGVEDKPLDMLEFRDLMQEKSPVELVEKQPTIRIRRGNEVEDVNIN